MTRLATMAEVGPLVMGHALTIERNDPRGAVARCLNRQATQVTMNEYTIEGYSSRSRFEGSPYCPKFLAENAAARAN
jgi:hypothetical protein